MIESYTRWIIRWKYLVVLATVAVVVAAAYGGQFLGFSNDYRMFFGEDNPQLLAFEKMQRTFNKNDNILFVVTPKSGKVFSRETLTVIKDITKEGWQIPFSTRVDSITNHQHTNAEGDDLIVDDLVVDPDALSDSDLIRIQSIAINEPMLVNRVISSDSKYAGINVTVQLPGKKLDEVPVAVAFARDIKERMLEKYPDVEIRLVGMAVMNNAFPEASMDDVANLYPLALGFIALTLFLLLRGLSGTVATFIMVILSIMTAMGLAGWSDILLSPPVMSAPIMILTMAIADAVHLLVTMRHELALGADKNKAIIESMRINFRPILVTSITTVLGFLSLNFSDAPPFHDLGNIAAMGVAAAFFLSITFLPAVVSILPATGKHEVAGKQMMAKFGEFVIAKQKPLLIGNTLIIILLAALVPLNELNDNFVEYFDESIEFRRDSDYASENLTGVYYIDYALSTEESGGISNPDYLSNVAKFSQFLRTQPDVIHVQTISDTFKRLNKNMHGDDPAWHRLPEERNLAAQYLLLYEMSLPYGLDLNNQIDIDKSATKIAVTLKTLTSNEVIAFDNIAMAWLEENTPSIKPYSSGPTIMFAHLGKRNINSMLIGTSIALVFISAILIFFLGSFKYGMISLIPNLTPALAAFGIWGITVGQVGIGLSIVTGMTLGIVVDDTVHFLSKYLRARREKGLSAEDAVRYAFNNVGLALLVTSLVLVAGFMIMAQSHFYLNSSMGLLTSVVIMLALIIDLTFLPPLLMKFAGNSEGKQS
ncbi:Predicted exporter of the RND superfamily [hydrothermal vent metagenome]|uniref:Predicted exporter of the RND superfamily n=1 Tax=hydrothermal vent metagenome TaxID=652676 RepID=A0A3B0W3R7_9ZZZZ